MKPLSTEEIEKLGQMKVAVTLTELLAASSLPAAAAGGVAGYRKGGLEGAARGAAGAGMGGLVGGMGGAIAGGGRTVSPALLTMPLGALAGYKATTHGMTEKKAFHDALLEEFGKISFQTSQYSGPLSYGRFKMESGQPNLPVPSLQQDPTKKQGGEKQAGVMTGTGITPAARLSSSMRVAAPKVTAPSGPSIAQIAKPHGFGKPLAGATKSF